MEPLIENKGLLDNEERERLLVDWNDTRTDYPRNLCIHQLFEQQAELRPQAVALRFRDRQMTYEQLNRKANQVAVCLRRLGVGPEVMVATLLERSLEMVVGLLGILKAGGAYVPLDANYPAERLAFMASDTNAPVMLVQNSTIRGMVEQNWSGARTVSMDADEFEINLESEENLSHHNTSDNLAYVMYTSGSTGRPKGVMVSHRAVVRLVKNTNYADLNEKEVFLQFSPVSFDASTLEIWAPLLNGGCLAIMPPETQSLDELGAAIRTHGVTSMWLTAGLFNVMVEQRLEDLRPLRQLLVGGDTLSPTHIRKAMEALPGCRLINGYGPTEGTTFTCCHTITREDAKGSSIPIGKPISNTQVYLLGSDLQPVPLGEIGELHIGGEGLARGYLNAPELTAEKFIPNPFGEHPGECIYKTGDLVRYRPEGTIEFLGRSDHQVKVNGFRIELGEVESVLMNHPAVRSAVVIARPEPGGEKKLAAYVVLHTQDADTSDIRVFVQRRLPSYMLPSFVVLKSLPLSPNGKVDRAALPAPEVPQSSASSGNSPDTDLEGKITAIWQRVLRQKQIGVNENFFDLGGDSLELLAAHAELQKAISPDLPITAMFQYTTVSALAQYLSGANDVSHVTKAQERARKQQTAWAQHRPSQMPSL